MDPKDLPVAPADTIAVPTVPVVKEETIESMNPAPAPKAPDSVPLSKYMEEKREKRELEQELATLKAQKGPSETVDYEKLSKDYGGNPELLKMIFSEINKNKAAPVAETPKMDDATAQKLQEFEDFKNRETFDKKFDELYGKALDIVPDYKDITSKETIKALAKLPENRNNTMSQIIENTYRHAVKGIKTIESATPAAGKKGETVPDMATMDDESWKATKSDPAALAKYNEHILANAINYL